MPEIMEAEVWDLGLLERRPPVPFEVGEPLALRRGEYE
jgi:hypothetical protein